jgi:AmmeMemoRadiSam system protein A
LKVFDPVQREIVLKLARNAIVTFLETRTVPVPPDDDFLTVPSAAFVTVKINSELRGCIGSTEASEPLGDAIIHCAISAAFRDPRFPPLTKQEYPGISLEVSVLSPFQKIASPDDVIPGVHGLLITQNMRRGLLLPQVATEYKWDRETFLMYASRKAGLADDAWKDPSTIIEMFTAEVFSE